jgi:nicotinamide mononucleotide transporter
MLDILEHIFGVIVYLFTTLEGWSFVLSLCYVALSVRKNIYAWLFAIVASFLYAWVCFQSKLYPTLLLQIFFILSSIYGFVEWRKANYTYSKSNWQYTKLSTIAWLFFISLIFIITGLSLLLSSLYTGLPNSIWFKIEVLAASASVVAQYLDAKRCIHAWHLWFVVNIAYICINYKAGLYSFSVLYGIFAILSIIGYVYWKKHNQRNMQNLQKIIVHT